MRRSKTLVASLTLAGVTILASSMAVAGQGGQAQAAAGITATATLVDQFGSAIGSATFFENPAGHVIVGVDIDGLAPGEHGMHIHAVGACATTGQFSSAGGHFNPTGASHGGHAGDLGNLLVNSAGKARTQFETTRFSLSAGTFSLFDADGSAIVVHADPDDGVTNPAGNSGPRVACGVITPR